MAFRFRQFTVEDQHSTMPVGTDAMLLGAWTQPAGAKRILDIGTGCGVLALMMAQRSTAAVTAIDIDARSAAEAGLNFKQSPWSERLQCHGLSLQDFQQSQPGTFDLIICNPPFFSGSLRSPSLKRNLARHEAELTHRGLLASVRELLGEADAFATVMPSALWEPFTGEAAIQELHPVQELWVRSFARKPPLRVLALFRKTGKVANIRQELVIFDVPGKFSTEYLELTAEFHSF